MQRILVCPLMEEEKMLTLANVGKDKNDIIIEVTNLHPSNLLKVSCRRI